MFAVFHKFVAKTCCNNTSLQKSGLKAGSLQPRNISAISQFFVQFFFCLSEENIYNFKLFFNKNNLIRNHYIVAFPINL